jgi:hypothetical protein
VFALEVSIPLVMEECGSSYVVASELPTIRQLTLVSSIELRIAIFNRGMDELINSATTS